MYEFSFTAFHIYSQNFFPKIFVMFDKYEKRSEIFSLKKIFLLIFIFFVLNYLRV